MTIKVGEETYYSEEYVKELKEELERLNMVVTIQEDYKSRNEKATEYIKNSDSETTDMYEICETCKNDLLNILKGEK